MYAEMLIALTIRAFFFQPFSLPSSSQIPTLLPGDYVFVSKFAYGYSRYSLPAGQADFPGRVMAVPPKRGDIVVFKLPKDGKTDYMKRVVGFPGDRIQMKDHLLYINGQEVEHKLLSEYDEDGGAGPKRRVRRYSETLPGGVTHLMQIYSDGNYWSNTPVYTVPPDNYFVLGDNRDNSSDSRIPPEQGGVGYVPFENFEGRAEIIYFSLDGDASVWSAVRWGRIFQKVR